MLVLLLVMSANYCAAWSLSRQRPAAGRVEQLGDLTAYVSRPSPSAPPQGAILLVHDIFGWELSNTRLVADALAEQGYLVVEPDFFSGEPFALLSEAWPPPANRRYLDGALGSSFVFPGVLDDDTLARFLQWRSNKSPAVVKTHAPAIAAWLRAQGALPPYGIVGFCWGGRAVHMTLLDAMASRDYCAGVALYGHAMTAEGTPGVAAGAVVKPLAFLFGEADEAFPTGEVELLRAALRERAGDQPWRVSTYAGQGHGFAHRSDIEDEQDRLRAREAADDAVQWLQMHAPRAAIDAQVQGADALVRSLGLERCRAGEWLTVAGFGSLMDEQSARQTSPSLRGFRYGWVEGYCRIFNLASIINIRRGLATGVRLATCTARPRIGCQLRVCLYEIPVAELPTFYAREARLRLSAVAYDAESVVEGSERALMCTEFSDAEYRCERCPSDHEYACEVAQYYGGALYRDDMLPVPSYLYRCVRAHALAGEDALRNFLTTSFLGDATTTLVEHLRQQLAAVEADAADAAASGWDLNEAQCKELRAWLSAVDGA